MDKRARKLLCGICLFLPYFSMSQLTEIKDTTEEQIYYIGINPMAPFTGIRSDVTSQYLPVLSNHETGISVFVGTIRNKKYNLETRLSFGSPLKSLNVFQVHSGLNYCFDAGKRNWHPYTGMFIKLYSLHNLDTETDYNSVIAYLCAGNRFIWNKYFLDLRLNQNLYAVSWTNTPGAKARSGFSPSIYKWNSAYIPYIALGIGYTFR